LKIIYHNPLHSALQKIIFWEGLDLLKDTQVISMEKQHSSIFGQEFVRKQNDGINKVVNTLIPGWDKKCQVKNIRHQEWAWDDYNHNIHFLFSSEIQTKKSNNVCETLKNENRRGWNPHQTSRPRFGESSICGIPTKVPYQILVKAPYVESPPNFGIKVS